MLEGNTNCDNARILVVLASRNARVFEAKITRDNMIISNIKLGITSGRLCFCAI